MWSSWSRHMPSWQQIHPKLCDPPGQGTCLHDNKTRWAQHYLLRTVCDPPGQGTCLHDNKYILSYVILLVKVHAFMTTKLDELNITYWEQYVILLVKAHAFMTTKLDWRHVPWPGGSHNLGCICCHEGMCLDQEDHILFSVNNVELI